MGCLKDVVKFFDNLPWIGKIICALPFLDGLLWGVYRLCKGIDTKDTILIIAGIVWIFVGFFLLWIIDMVTICLYKKPTVLVGGGGGSVAPS